MPNKRDAVQVESLYREVRSVLEQVRASAYRAVNFAMVHAYWQVGRLIVEYEQGGRRRAGYGESLLEDLSHRLTSEFGRGFDPSNLRYMRLFFQRFSNRDAVRHESSAAENRNTVRSKSWNVIKRDAPGLELGPSDAARMYLKRVDAPVGVKPAGWS